MSPNYLQSVRGFAVLFTHPGWEKSSSPFYKKRGKVFSLPCRGGLLYTGEEALKVMKSYANRGFTVAAKTETAGNVEELTLGEMEEMFGELNKELTMVHE